MYSTTSKRRSFRNSMPLIVARNDWIRLTSIVVVPFLLVIFARLVLVERVRLVLSVFV